MAAAKEQAGVTDLCSKEWTDFSFAYGKRVTLRCKREPGHLGDHVAEGGYTMIEIPLVSIADEETDD